MQVDKDPGALTINPTVEEALDRLAGRRATAIELAANHRMVTQTVGQCRKTRRNNLRLARIEARKVAKSTSTVRITDSSGAVRFEPATDEQLDALFGVQEPT